MKGVQLFNMEQLKLDLGFVEDDPYLNEKIRITRIISVIDNEEELIKHVISHQNLLIDRFDYKILPKSLLELNYKAYIASLPNLIMSKPIFVDLIKGYYLEGKKLKLYSVNGTLIASKYDRVVVGEYGPFIEIANEDINLKNLVIPKSEEYRKDDENYKDKVKYLYYTTNDKSNIKLYYQQKEVKYADYKIHKWYVSPYYVVIKN